MQKEEQINIEALESDSFVSPSFNSYSTDQLATVAEQIGRVHYLTQNDDFGFEFVAFRKAEDNNDHEFSYFNDNTVFPLFNHDLLKESDGRNESSKVELRFPVRRLLIAGGEDHRSESYQSPSLSSGSSWSSSDDDLDGIPPGTYCVWTPNSPQASPSRCKKSNSTGSSSSSKRWKLLNFLRRSNSDGKESLVFLAAPAKKEQRITGSTEVAGKLKVIDVSGGGKKEKAAVAVQEALYVKRVDKRRSYLPYKEELIAIPTSRLRKKFLPSRK
ncbi:hypothetical protein PIB30_082715 [Stylosanthes scabra]|uniref:Uncharacterized protein n=1 Tax=Stylosanthes scabra TaxID=79078 RepID=A0ABU6WRU6_9FABA|nr:hypothetical protein [Stylosanthes scabra]